VDNNNAPNNSRYEKPQTIDELRMFCESKGMPLEKMRFFIGEDYKGARAFGIFQEKDGDFVVYKNKADGSRAIRYKGTNEKFAVNEIYEKLRAETDMRRHYAPPVTQNGPRRLLPFCLSHYLIIIIAVIVFGTAAKAIHDYSNVPRRGYYRFSNNDYYYYANDWYEYDYSIAEWILLDFIDPILEEYCYDYYLTDYYDGEYGFSNFEDSEYWDESYYGYDYYYADDDDYDWDYDDWDSWDYGDSDWDSDW